MLGCAVNGIGEASHADFGITGAKNEGLIFAHGKPLRKVPQAELVDALFVEIDKSLDRGEVDVDEGKSAEGAAWLKRIEDENADELTPERIAAMEAEAARPEARRGSVAGDRAALHACLIAFASSVAAGGRGSGELCVPATRASMAIAARREAHLGSPGDDPPLDLLPPDAQGAPADAEATSHKLMVRAGLIRQLAAGLWTYLPAGWRVERKVEGIIREEMDAIGAHEMLMPVLQPAEIWRESGRYEIPELFKLEDRRHTELVLAMTHEESMTYQVGREIRSYRELPLILYHIQTKERDEPRPRAGVLRTREFTMKDSYSLDRDEAGLEESYRRHIGAYDRILDRCGLRWYRVESDVGMMGGLGAHEYMAPCEAGENEVAIAPDYAANVEIATAEPRRVDLPPRLEEPTEVPTPGLTTVEEASSALGMPAAAALKAIPVVAEDRGFVLTLVRGDHRLNEIKLRNALGSDFRQARPEEIESELGPPGFIGPVGASVPVIRDAAIRGESYFAGANRPDAHLIGVAPGRDFASEEADIRAVEPGDRSPAGHAIEIEPAIEIANIFKLGTRYSEPLGATYLDESGSERPIVMGQLRNRTRPNRRGGDRAARRRSRNRVAALDRAVADPPHGARQAGRRQRGRGRGPVRGSSRHRSRGAVTMTATPGPARSSPTPS